jgi:putative DNA primase/helicase
LPAAAPALKPDNQKEQKMTAAEEIIEALGGNVRSGMACCPAHDDTNPSLHVTEAPNGKVLFHCFAGCPQDAVLDALRSRGLRPEKGHTMPNNPRHADATYAAEEEFLSFLDAVHILRAAQMADASKPRDYLAGRGIEIVPPCAMTLPAQDYAYLTDTRCGGKRFSKRFKDYPAMVLPVIGSDGLLKGAQATFLASGGTLNLREDGSSARRSYGTITGGYALLAPVDPDRALIVGEGIETTLSAMQITGLPGIATLGTSNMQHVNPPPVSEIIIAADNDDPGRKAAKALAQRLGVPGRTVRVAVAPGEQKCDWNDVLRSKADRDELREMLLRAPIYEPAKVASLGMKEFMQLEFPKREYLLKPRLTTTGLAMLYADPGVGKTRLAMSMGYAVASGKALLGWQVEHPAPILFVDGEMPGELLQRWLGELGPTLPDKQFQILSYAMLEVRGVAMPDLGTEAGRDFLDQIIERNKTELIILDAVSTLVRSGVENDAESWRAVQDWSLKHRLRGRAVLYLHHTGRSGKMRGTSMREVVIDTAIRLRGLPDRSTEQETAVELSYAKHRGFFGKDTAPLVVRFGTASGQIEWSAEPMLPEHAEEVAAMRDEGYNNTQIAKKLGLTKQRIGQIVEKMKEADAE